MKGFAEFIRKIDDFAAAPVEGSILGGTLSLAAYILVAAYLIAYSITVSKSTYPTTTEISVFPNEAAESLILPPMNCIATSGCYIKAMQGTSDISGSSIVNQCVYLAQGEALPDAYRYMFYDSDPVNYFTVLSTDNDKSFALSYDVEKVTGYRKILETETLAAAVDDTLSTPMPYKLYKGVSVFNLIRTVGLDKTVDTWTNTVTTETTTFDGTGGCCGATVYDKDGNNYPTGTNTVTTSACNSNKPGVGSDWWMTKFVPPTTYVTVTVSNPLDAFELLGLLGGWLGLAFSLAGTVYWVYDEYLWITGAEEDEGKDGDGKDPEEVEMVSTT
jgi:hypothetical protein